MNYPTVMNRLKFLSISLASLLTPALAFAQEEGDIDFINSFELWIALAVGVLATVIVLRNAHKIGKSSLQKVYYFFGFGMLLTVFGFLSVVIPLWTDPFIIMRVHNVLFIVAFGLMAYGASKMLSDVSM